MATSDLRRAGRSSVISLPHGGAAGQLEGHVVETRPRTAEIVSHSRQSSLFPAAPARRAEPSCGTSMVEPRGRRAVRASRDPRSSSVVLVVAQTRAPDRERRRRHRSGAWRPRCPARERDPVASRSLRPARRLGRWSRRGVDRRRLPPACLRSGSSRSSLVVDTHLGRVRVPATISTRRLHALPRQVHDSVSPRRSVRRTLPADTPVAASPQRHPGGLAAVCARGAGKGRQRGARCAARRRSQQPSAALARAPATSRTARCRSPTTDAQRAHEGRDGQNPRRLHRRDIGIAAPSPEPGFPAARRIRAGDGPTRRTDSSKDSPLTLAMVRPVPPIRRKIRLYADARRWLDSSRRFGRQIRRERRGRRARPARRSPRRSRRRR